MGYLKNGVKIFVHLNLKCVATWGIKETKIIKKIKSQIYCFMFTKIQYMLWVIAFSLLEWYFHFHYCHCFLQGASFCVFKKSSKQPVPPSWWYMTNEGAQMSWLQLTKANEKRFRWYHFVVRILRSVEGEVLVSFIHMPM